jgi:predicted RNA binding protein with dsRBD fold (UPF0201 family)
MFLNKVHLNILNSFEDNKIRNKPFKYVLNAKTRVKYFNFFSLFLIFFFRALSKDLKENISYFKVDNSIVTIYNALNFLVEEEGDIDSSSRALHKTKRAFNKKLGKLRLSSLIQETSSSSSSSDSDSSSNSGSDSSSNSNSSSTSSSNSNSTSTSNRSKLDSSNKEILQQIKDINQSKDSLSLQIKELLIELLIKLLKQKTNLYIFDSAVNSFFACISIRAKDYSFKDSVDLSQDYSKFIYSTQLIVIEYSFSLLLKDNTLDLTTILKDFRDQYLNNSTNSALSEVLHNRAYCFKVNKETSTLNYISISNTKKETVSYKKITISVDNLRLLFKELISSSYSLLVEKLLFNISKSRYKEITLEEFSKLEDRSLTTPFKYFKP